MRTVKVDSRWNRSFGGLAAKGRSQALVWERPVLFFLRGDFEVYAFPAEV
jgi:hypothetical protein